MQNNKSWLMLIPLVLLAILSILGGYIELNLSGVFLNATLDTQSYRQNEPYWLHTVAVATPFVGFVIAFFLYFPRKNTALEEPNTQQPGFFESGLGFDSLYNVLFVTPFVWLANINKSDVIDTIVKFMSWYTVTWHETLKATQNGQLRWYAATLALGVIVLLAIVISYLPTGAN